MVPYSVLLRWEKLRLGVSEWWYARRSLIGRDDVFDEEGNNAAASFMLNDHHDAVGYSGYGDEIHDNCLVCPFAVGWVQPTVLGPDEWGHSTTASVREVRAWIRQYDRSNR